MALSAAYLANTRIQQLQWKAGLRSEEDHSNHWSWPQEETTFDKTSSNIFSYKEVSSPCPLRPPVLLGMILVCGNPTSLNTDWSMFGKYEVIRYQLFVDKYDNAVLNLLKVGRVPANWGSAISYLPWMLDVRT